MLPPSRILFAALGKWNSPALFLCAWAAGACLVSWVTAAVGPAGQGIERVSVAADGGEADDYSWQSAISADGRVVAFQSNSANLGAVDGNGVHDVYLRDLNANTTELISVGLGGAAANAVSDFPDLSADGNRVAFYSDATDLIATDTNGMADIFVRDRALQQTVRVSVSSSGGEANGPSFSPAISGNGRWVAFLSLADNLVAVDTNGLPDVFVHDLQTGSTMLASVSAGGVLANGANYTPTLSYDGRYLAFRSAATNLVAADGNAQHDIFWRDLQTGATEIVSLSDSGAAANHRSDYPSLSADGQRIAFRSTADNLVPGDVNQLADIFVRDRQLAITRRVSARTAANGGLGGSGNTGAGANGMNYDPMISANGRFVVFRSAATNLARGDSNGLFDIYCHDLSTGICERISVGDRHQQGNGEGWYPAINADGTAVAFKCYSDNLGVLDQNGHSDIYLRWRRIREVR